MAGLSPMMKHYMEVREQNPGRIVFYRVGDFFEMFFDDAVLVSKELDITLTGKECGLEERAPMCGVPHHSVNAYVKRLVDKGYKVAICDQTEDAALAKGLVRREVVQVVSAGTVIDDSMLEDDKNNYLLAALYHEGRAGLCFADISTGSVQTTVLEDADIQKALVSELARFDPSEILFNAEMLELKEVMAFIKQSLHSSVELLDDEEYGEELAQKRAVEQFGPRAGAWFESGQKPEGYCALGALLGYLARTQNRGVRRLGALTQYTEDQFMNLSPTSRANLELTQTMRTREKRGSLLWVLDKTGTSMGKRLLRRWIEQPLTGAKLISARHDAVEELFKNNVARIEIFETLDRVADMERLMTRVFCGTAAPRELRALADTCALLPGLKKQLEPFESDELTDLAAAIDDLSDVRGTVDRTLSEEPPATLKEGGVIRPGFSDEVDELRRLASGSKEVLSSLEQQLREETGIRTLRVRFNKVFGYFIEVSKSFIDKVPETFIRKQTLTTGERYITEPLKEIENKIVGAEERLDALERDLYKKLLEDIAKETARIQLTAEALAKLDVYCAFAQCAVANHYVRPQVDEGDAIEITAGRHPVVELMQREAPFVPNDTRLDCDENRMQIITGPNMAGKSTYMRQVALITIMAQIGAFIPAEAGRIGVCDAVFTRVGASDDLASGQSTFMVEMTEVAEILELATAKSLVILDEIGRGTSTFDGMSIAQGVVEYITDPSLGPGCKTLFATHYHELTDLENNLDGVKNYNIMVKKRGDDITFLRRIVRGPADDSYGIEVAKLAGLPKEVLDRSKQVLKVLESQARDIHRTTQLDFESFAEINSYQPPSEIIQRLEATDPETLTPIEALNLVYELKKSLGNSQAPL